MSLDKPTEITLRDLSVTFHSFEPIRVNGTNYGKTDRLDMSKLIIRELGKKEEGEDGKQNS